jgi:hypothetical protein
LLDCLKVDFRVKEATRTSLGKGLADMLFDSYVSPQDGGGIEEEHRDGVILKVLCSIVMLIHIIFVQLFIRTNAKSNKVVFLCE